MYQRILKYLPPFILLKSITVSILTVIAGKLSELQDEIENLPEKMYEGKIIKKQLDEYKIFYLPTDSDLVLQEKLENWETICSKRGTKSGVAYDLSCLETIGDTIVKGLGEVGEIIGDYNNIDDPCTALDMQKAIILYPKDENTIDSFTKSLIMQYIIPIDIKPIFME